MFFALLPTVPDFDFYEDEEANQYVRGFLTKVERDTFLSLVDKSLRYRYIYPSLQPRAVTYTEAKPYLRRNRCVFTRDTGTDPVFETLPADFSIASESDVLASMIAYPAYVYMVPSEYQTREVQLTLCEQVQKTPSLLFHIKEPIPEMQRAFLALLGDGKGEKSAAAVSVLTNCFERLDFELLEEAKTGLGVLIDLMASDTQRDREIAVMDLLGGSAGILPELPDMAIEF